MSSRYYIDLETNKKQGKSQIAQLIQKKTHFVWESAGLVTDTELTIAQDAKIIGEDLTSI